MAAVAVVARSGGSDDHTFQRIIFSEEELPVLGIKQLVRAAVRFLG
jgi:hypothetical protein